MLMMMVVMMMMLMMLIMGFLSSCATGSTHQENRNVWIRHLLACSAGNLVTRMMMILLGKAIDKPNLSSNATSKKQPCRGSLAEDTVAGFEK